MVKIAAALSNLAIVTSAAVTPPSRIINIHNALLASVNLTVTPNLPDARFTVTTSFDPKLLPPIPALVNILDCIAIIAYTDYNGFIPPSTWTAPGYPQVQIVTEDRIAARYILFGILTGIGYMVKWNRFQDVILTLKWEGDPVGTIRIESSPHHLQISSRNNSSSPTGRIAAVPAPSELAYDTGSLKEDIQIDVTPLLGSSPLSRNNVFLLSYSALIHLAPFDASTQMPDFVTNDPDETMTLAISGTSQRVEVYRGIQVVNYLPKHMLVDGFKEVSFELSIDGVSVLDGTLSR